MTYHTESIRITGYLVGNIWMPNIECWKHLDFDATDYEARCSAPLTLREMTLAATRDGDFQGCDIADGTLIVIRRAENGFTHRRSFALDRFPSIADMTRTDWDGPTWDEDE